MVKLKEKLGSKRFLRGEVWKAELRPAKGHEQTKERRVLIVQNDVANEYSSCITVVPITSYQGERLYPVEVLLTAPEGGTTTDSVIQASQIRTLDKELRFTEYCGRVSESTMSKVDEALKIHLGLVPI
jgi:mRNA interferase MazF